MCIFWPSAYVILKKMCELKYKQTNKQTLMDCHKNAEATRSELEELGDLAKDEEDLGDVSRATDKTEQDIPPADTKLGTTGKHDRLDNTLRLNG
jgi:hypothetical protein